MLKLRICPKCQEETRSFKVYFCHRCGAELPPPPEVKGKYGVGGEDKTKKASRVVVLSLVIVALTALGLGGFYFYSRFRSASPSAPSSPPPSYKNETFVSGFSFPIEDHPFSAKGLSEMVPADVDLYLESADPELVLPSLVSSDDWARVESVLTERVGLSAEEAASFLEDEFAVIQESTASAFLARARDVDFLEQKISEVGEYEWEVRLVEGFLIISNSPDLIQSIEEAQRKLTLNLSLTSGFAEARKKLPQTGQIFYYGKKRPDFIPDSIKGEAFVVSKKNEGILIVGL